MKVQARPGRALSLELEGYERPLLRELLSEMRTLLNADIPRADPVIARIFPDAYEDEADADSYRELVGSDLRDEKLRNLEAVSAGVDEDKPIDIGDEELSAWLATVTDMRLAIGTRLEITEDHNEQEIDPEDPEGPALAVLDWLGWLLTSILDALETRDSDREAR